MGILEGLAGWVGRAVDALAALKLAISERAEVATNVRTAATSDLESALTSIDVDSADELVQVLAKGIAREAQAKTDLAAARAQVPVAVELDQQIADGHAFLDNVELVRSKLQPSAFIGHLINLRQQALLGVASAILSEISNDRFGFSDDFEIFDQLSGQPRSPRSLSGGETFSRDYFGEGGCGVMPVCGPRHPRDRGAGRGRIEPLLSSYVPKVLNQSFGWRFTKRPS